MDGCQVLIYQCQHGHLYIILYRKHHLEQNYLFLNLPKILMIGLDFVFALLHYIFETTDGKIYRITKEYLVVQNSEEKIEDRFQETSVHRQSATTLQWRHL